MSAPLLLAVLVLYRRDLEESEAFVSLREAIRRRPVRTDEMALLVYDNSPGAHAMPVLPIRTVYRHDPANGGLAPAYNAALALASEMGTEWVMLLDQDTLLHRAYVDEVLRFIQQQGKESNEIAAAVPRLRQGSEVHSPRSRPRWKHGNLPAKAYGLATQAITAYNSGAVVRVRSLQETGGFPEEYTLDFLDHAVFHRLQGSGNCIWLLRSEIEHQLSTVTLGAGISLDRYRRMLRNERSFYRKTARLADLFWYRVRLLRRFAGHMIRVRQRRFALLELRSLLGLRL